MSIIIVAIIVGVIGTILFAISVGLLIYYFVAKKGHLAKSLILLGVSIVLMIASFAFLIYKAVLKTQEENANSTAKNKEVANFYALSSEQKDILDNKTFEECDSNEISLIIQASVCIFKKEERAIYEPKVKEFYIKYFESIGYEREKGLEFYVQVRSQVENLEKTLK